MRRAVSVAVLIAIYALISEICVLPDPPFSRTGEVINFLTSKEFFNVILKDCSATVLITISSWFAGCVIGVMLGTIIALASRKAVILLGMIEVLRSIPSVMWIPFSIVLIGLGAKSVFTVSVLVVILFMASEIGYSTYLFRRERRLHFQRLLLPWWYRIRFVHFYEVLSATIPSSRVALTIALIVVVIAEMQAASQSGIGYRLMLFQASQRGDAMVSIMLLAGIIGLALNALMETIERKLVPWENSRGETL